VRAAHVQREVRALEQRSRRSFSIAFLPICCDELPHVHSGLASREARAGDVLGSPATRISRGARVAATALLLRCIADARARSEIGCRGPSPSPKQRWLSSEEPPDSTGFRSVSASTSAAPRFAAPWTAVLTCRYGNQIVPCQKTEPEIALHEP
jgi:hypothetical protein